MKNIIQSLRAWNTIRKNANILTVTADIFHFACDTQNYGRPMIKKIGLLHMVGSGESPSDFVSLWAGIGDANPIDRLSNVIRQRDSLKSLIKGIREADYIISEDDKKHIDMALKYFE